MADAGRTAASWGRRRFTVAAELPHRDLQQQPGYRSSILARVAAPDTQYQALSTRWISDRSWRASVIPSIREPAVYHGTDARTLAERSVVRHQPADWRQPPTVLTGHTGLSTADATWSRAHHLPRPTASLPPPLVTGERPNQTPRPPPPGRPRPLTRPHANLDESSSWPSSSYDGRRPSWGAYGGYAVGGSRMPPRAGGE